jgi:hypothetical protein
VPLPVNFPRTAHLTEQMATMVAQSIAAEVRGAGKRGKALRAECILDMGDRAALIKADPFRPPRNVARFSVGKRWLWAKQAFERNYLWTATRGRAVSGEWSWCAAPFEARRAGADVDHYAVIRAAARWARLPESKHARRGGRRGVNGV